MKIAEIAIIIAAVAFVAGVIIWNIVAKKKGKCGCCGDCSCCKKCKND